MNPKKKILVCALGAGMIISSANIPGINVLAEKPDTIESVLSSMTTQQLENYNQLQSVEREGLYLSQTVDLESEEPIKVIVQLDHHPEKIAKLKAELEGKNLSSTDAKANIEMDQKTFKNNVANMFKGKNAKGYKLGKTYKNAMNGVSMELPANKVKELLSLDVVRSVWSDVEVQVEPPVIDENQENKQVKPYMMESIPHLGIDKLHKEGFTGKGIKVGVLDTGIDYNHPDLDGVYKGGYDFVDDDNDPMEATYEDWKKSGNPEFAGSNSYYTEHGTHVAGTIAGEGDNESEYHIKGVAPEADLYAYRVLGPYGSGSSEGVIAGIDRAIEDGMDVINLSLGAMINDPLYPTSIAVNNAVLSGVTAVVSAGNSGSGSFTLGSPGTAALALTVGASDVPVDIPTFNGQYGSEKVNLQLMARNYSDKLEEFEGLSSTVVDVGLGKNTDYYGKPSVAGKVVLISRGEIAFVDKIKVAKEKGAKAILLYNNNAEEGQIPHYLGEGVDFIPTFTLTKEHGEALKNSLESDQDFTFSDMGAITTEGDRLADFSSRGPSRSNYDIKPEITAPGVGVLSTVPSYINDKENGSYDYAYARLSGTSMASPHIAGISALLLQSNKEYKPEDIKSILMNTSDPLNGDYSVYEVGAGRVDPYEAIHSDMNFQVIDETTNLQNGERMTIDEVTGGMSFGLQYVGEKSLRNQRTILVENNGEENKTFVGKVEFTNQSLNASENGVQVSFNKKLTVKAGKKKKTNVFLNVPKSAEKGYYEGYIHYVNEADESENYQIPFGIRVSEKGIEYVNALNFSTKDNNQFRPVIQFTPMDFVLKSPMDQLSVVLVDGKTNEDLGLVGVINSKGIPEGQRIILNDAFSGNYYPYEDHSISINPTMAPEGHYKLKLVGVNSEGETFTSEADTYIDNTAAEFSSSLPTGVYEYENVEDTMAFSMKLYDKTIEDMKAAGLQVDQSKNGIEYYYGSSFPTGMLYPDANGNLSDEIQMNSRLSVYPLGFFGYDSVGNFSKPVINFFVPKGTPYVTASMNQDEAKAGDLVKYTLSAENVEKLSDIHFSTTYDTNQLKLVDVKIHPDFEKYGHSSLEKVVTKKSASSNQIDIDVSIDENSEVEATGDIPVVEITLEAQDTNYNKTSFITGPTLSGTYTNVTGTDTNLRGYYEGEFTELLRSHSEVRGRIVPQGFYGTDGKFDYEMDFSNAPITIDVTDSEGNVFDGEIKNDNQFRVELPVTDKPFNMAVKVPGHFPVNTTFHVYEQREDKIVATWSDLALRTQDAGDINQDSVIDILDALALKENWGTDKQEADLNFDGNVDEKDFELVEFNYMETDPGVKNAPKPKDKYKGQTLKDIKTELGIE